jgi:serine/threonine protein kinase
MTSEKQGAQDFTEIAKYRILKRLGAGTYGRVYLGQHPLLDRQVAIKVFLGNIDTTRDRERFLHEAQMLDQLKHPHILPFYDVGIQEGLLERDIAYLLIEYAPNGSLRNYLDTSAPKPLPLQEALSLLSQIGAGLQYAHQHHIVHRDIKPENILFNAKGEALLADFGIAIVLSSGTQSGESIGTPAYMAPEQLQGSVSQKSDQYALGCIAYEMVTGHPPFSGPDRDAFISQQMYQRPLSPRQLNPDLPVSVEQAILRALAKDRDARYPDIPAFLTALQRPSVAPPLIATPEAFQNVRRSSRMASSLSIPSRALRPQEDDDDLFAYPIGRRNRRAPQPPSSRSHTPFPRIPVTRIQVRAPRRGGDLRRQELPQSQHDWRIILTCFFGLGGTIGGSALLASSQNFSLPFHILFVIVGMIGVVALFMGMVQAIVGSYRTRDWKWFTLLVAGPVIAGLLGLMIGKGGGLSAGFLFGLFFTTVLSILYGWKYPPQRIWIGLAWFVPTNTSVTQTRRRRER